MTNNDIKRLFIPGEEWVYFKIYSGVQTADRILVEVVDPLIKNLFDNDLISKWFFIRYNDTGEHLRVRILLKEKQYYHRVIEKFNELIKNFVDWRLVHKVQQDTYTRELERYGPDKIELAESIFFYTSDIYLSLISYLYDTDSEDLKWKLAIKVIDILLESFNYNLDMKYQTLSSLQEGFSNEFQLHENKSLKKAVNKKYRENEGDVSRILDFKIEEILQNKEISIIFNRFHLNLKNLFDKYKLEIDDTFFYSNIHMIVNRWFRTEQRLHELVIYKFMWKYYSKMKKLKGR